MEPILYLGIFGRVGLSFLTPILESLDILGGTLFSFFDEFLNASRTLPDKLALSFSLRALCSIVFYKVFLVFYHLYFSY